MDDLRLEDRSVEPDPCERCRLRRNCHYECNDPEWDEEE